MSVPCGDDFLVPDSHVVMISSASECHNPETEIDQPGVGEGGDLGRENLPGRRFVQKWFSVSGLRDTDLRAA